MAPPKTIRSCGTRGPALATAARSRSTTYPQRVAVCLYLMGQKDRAREFTRAFLAAEPAYFERFARPFLNLLSAEAGD